MLGTEPRPQRWEARVLPLCYHGPSPSVRHLILNIHNYLFLEFYITLPFDAIILYSSVAHPQYHFSFDVLMCRFYSQKESFEIKLSGVSLLKILWKSAQRLCKFFISFGRMGSRCIILSFSVCPSTY